MVGKVIRVSAAVVLDDDSRILLVRKRGTTAFMQPGGKIDPDETPAQALQRELAEELGVTVCAADIRELGPHVAAAANEPGHTVDAELYAVTLHEEPHACGEIAEITWCDPAAPIAIELAPLTRDSVLPLVRAWLRSAAGGSSANVIEL